MKDNNMVLKIFLFMFYILYFMFHVLYDFYQEINIYVINNNRIIIEL